MSEWDGSRPRVSSSGACFDDPDTHLRLIVDHSPDLILTLDRDAKIQFINHTLPQFTVEQVLGTSAFDYVQDADRARYRQAFFDVLVTGETRELEILSEGPACWLARFVPVSTRKGRVEGVLVIATDITERKKSEQALRESESRFRTLAECTSAAIFVVQGSRVIYANRAAEIITGYRLAEMSRMAYGELFHPEHRERVKALSVGRDQGPGRFEAKLITRQGEERWVDYGASVFELGSAPAIIGTAVDVTDRKRAEEERRELEAQVQHAQRLESLGVLAGGIAHDFNNLLTGILGSASLAAMKIPADSPAAEQISRVLTAAEKAAELTSKMLAYAGKGQFSLEPLDLNRIVEEVLPLVRGSLGKISFQLALAPNLPSIEADRNQLQQVVVSLLTNAAEALAREIVVRTGAMTAGEVAPYPSVFLEIRDDGTGMGEQTRARIFDPFFTTKFTGRGLGLSAVAGIVKRHGGTIRVETAPQRGTSFTVLFPARPPAKADPSDRPLDDAGLANEPGG
jgi:PAS domain S-box-containing protein